MRQRQTDDVRGIVRDRDELLRREAAASTAETNVVPMSAPQEVS